MDPQLLNFSNRGIAWFEKGLMPHPRRENNMKIGVLGSGDVAKALGGGFLKHGHEVMMGPRTPAKLADWGTQNPKGRVGGFADVAKQAVTGILEQFGWETADMG